MTEFISYSGLLIKFMEPIIDGYEERQYNG